MMLDNYGSDYESSQADQDDNEPGTYSALGVIPAAGLAGGGLTWALVEHFFPEASLGAEALTVVGASVASIICATEPIDFIRERLAKLVLAIAFGTAVGSGVMIAGLKTELDGTAESHRNATRTERDFCRASGWEPGSSHPLVNSNTVITCPTNEL